jgi:hypothetical protein
MRGDISLLAVNVGAVYTAGDGVTNGVTGDAIPTWKGLKGEEDP